MTASHSSSSGRSTGRAFVSSPRSGARSGDAAPSASARTAVDLAELVSARPTCRGRRSPCCRFASSATRRTLRTRLRTRSARRADRRLSRAALAVRHGARILVPAARAGCRTCGDIGRLLGVRYCLSGTVERRGRGLGVTVELVDTRDGGVVWADRFYAARSTTCIACGSRFARKCSRRSRSASRCTRPSLARLAATENLDAWSAYHLGLQHLYRFNRSDNAAATALFAARGRARSALCTRARGSLVRALPERVPALHATTSPARSAHARALRRARPRARSARSVRQLHDGPHASGWRAISTRASAGSSARPTISPNYAQGIYARAWTEALAGRGRGRRSTSTSRCA